MDKVTAYFQQLSPREQLILMIGAPIAVLIVVLMGVNHSYQQMTSARLAYQQSLNEYQWLHADSGPVDSWYGEFGNRSLGPLTSSAELGLLLNENLKKYGINGNVSPDNNGRWRLSLNNSDGNRVLGFIEAAVGSGAVPEQIKLTRSSDKGIVNGLVVFTALMPATNGAGL